VLYLIRHGETEWNRLGRIQGTTDIPLSSRGEAQARRLANWMRNLRIHRAIASDLTRARRTAELVFGESVPVSVDLRLRERSFGPFEGCTVAEIVGELRNRFGEVPEPFDPVDAWPYPVEVESLEGLLERALAVILEILEEAHHTHIALVTHGNVVHVLLAHLLQIQAKRAIRLPNCCCIELEPRKGRLMLRSMISPEMLDASLI